MKYTYGILERVITEEREKKLDAIFKAAGAKDWRPYVSMPETDDIDKISEHIDKVQFKKINDVWPPKTIGNIYREMAKRNIMPEPWEMIIRDACDFITSILEAMLFAEKCGDAVKKELEGGYLERLFKEHTGEIQHKPHKAMMTPVGPFYIDE